MGRRIQYRRGPSPEEIAAAKKMQEDDLYQRGLIFIIAVIILSFLLTAGIWYLASGQIEWYILLGLPPLISLAVVSGLFRLLRWMKLLGI